MKKVTYLMIFLLSVTLMSTSCTKKDDNPVVPVVTPTNPMAAHIAGKWINVGTYFNGLLRPDIAQSCFELILNGKAIKTQTNDLTAAVYDSWTLSADNTTLTLICKIEPYYNEILIISSPPTAPNYNTMTLDHHGKDGTVLRFKLKKQ